MLDGVALPLVFAAKPHSFAKWFACLSEIINHPLLHEEEKYLGLWLAIQSINNESFSCSFNYEQISQAVNKSSRKIHRILTRLRVMGFLIADLPIYYGEPTLKMVQTAHTLKLVLPPKQVFTTENTTVLSYIRSQKTSINLIKDLNL